MNAKIQAFKLRRQGKSYNYINKKLGIAKSTLSGWFSDKEWSQKVKMNLQKQKRNTTPQNIIKLAQIRKRKKKERYNKYKREAKKEFCQLKSNPLFLTGLSIYWGEGEKANQGRVSVINSDVNMQKVVVNFYRKCLKIPQKKLRIALFIYPDHDENTIKDYWASNLNIPKSQFIKTQVLNSRSKRTNNKLKNGICNLYFCSTEIHVKIIKWLELIGEELRE